MPGTVSWRGITRVCPLCSPLAPGGGHGSASQQLWGSTSPHPRSDEPWGPYGSGKGAQGDRVTGCLWTSGSAAEPRENRGAEHSSLPSRAGPLMSRGDSEACLAWSPAGLLPGRNSASPGCWSPGLRESFGPHVSLCFCSTRVSSQGDS